MYLSQIQALAKKALAAGASRSGPTMIEWDISGRCQMPVPVVLHARPSAGKTRPPRLIGIDPDGEHLYVPGKESESSYIVVAPGTAIPMEVTLHTPCRRCDVCRKARARLWAGRAKTETASASRTWFCTLTLSPESATVALARARFHTAKSGCDFDALDYADQFRTYASAVNPEITKFLKRVRKNSGAALRYLLVTEAHKSGVPHFHALIHEVSPDGPVTYAVLKQAWRLGFSQFKLVSETRQATYVCKYLSKSLAARVRASEDYGNHALSIERVVREHMTPKKAPFLGLTQPNEPAKSGSLSASNPGASGFQEREGSRDSEAGASNG